MKPDTRIRFIKTVIEPADGDHPTFLLANEGETGIIVEKKEKGHPYNYSVRTDHCQETFSVKTNEIEEIKEDNV